MARTGLVNGFHFDKDVFTEYMQEKSFLKDALIVSGAVVENKQIRDLIGSKGNVGTMPLFSPIDGEADALNFDGATDNTPTELQGKKQTFMKIGRMKAWKDADFTRYLTGVKPVQNLADNLVDKYYQNQWQKTLLAVMKGAVGVTGMETHLTNIAVTEASITENNKVNESTLIELAQKSLGDMASNFGMVFMHSAVFATYQKLALVQYMKYTTLDAVQKEITLPTINGKIVVVDDSLVDTSVIGFPVYSTYLLGAGAFYGVDCDIPTPYDMEYDPETKGGETKFYTKQAKVLHPNGLSLKVDSIIKDSPTNAELANSANWELCFNHKNVAIACVKSNG